MKKLTIFPSFPKSLSNCLTSDKSHQSHVNDVKDIIYLGEGGRGGGNACGTYSWLCRLLESGAANIGLLQWTLIKPHRYMCLHSSPAQNLSEKKGIKPVTSDKDQMFDFKQKKANSLLETPLTPWVLYLGLWTELGDDNIVSEKDTTGVFFRTTLMIDFLDRRKHI